MTFNDITNSAVVRARVEISLGAVVTLFAKNVSKVDPLASTAYYRVPSRTPGQSHEVVVTGNANGVTLQCTCPAGVRGGRPCWHAGAVLLVLDGEVEAKQPTPLTRPASRPTAAELGNRASA